MTARESEPLRRDWVLRCDGSGGRVFEVGVTLGVVELHLPVDADCIRLELHQLHALRSALDDAVTCAEADLVAGARLG